jgi:LCP family protein required for cell wall assembly
MAFDQDGPDHDPAASDSAPHPVLDGDAVAPPEVETDKRKRRLWVQILAIVGVLVLVCSGAVVVGAVLLEHRYESKVERSDILKDLPKPPPPTVDLAPMNFLVLGSDSRDPNARGFDDTGSRSDTIMIVHILQGHKAAFIFSIPRDSYVYVPPVGDWSGGNNKINAAMAYGGASAAANTVYQLTKIPLNGAFVFNFDAVQNMIAVVGKVHVCLPYTVYDTFNNQQWDQGCQDMDPKDAQYFMQMRMGVPGGDFGRIYDQQLIVKALASQIASSGMLNNPIQLDRLISIAAESITVDQHTDLRSLILELKDIKPENLSFATTPWTTTMMTDAGSSVQLDMPAAQELFQAVIDDKTDAWLAAHPQGVPQGFGPPASGTG